MKSILIFHFVSFIGDLFWKCATETCYLLDFCIQRPAANDLDVGQFQPLGTLPIDRSFALDMFPFLNFRSSLVSKLLFHL